MSCLLPIVLALGCGAPCEGPACGEPTTGTVPTGTASTATTPTSSWTTDCSRGTVDVAAVEVLDHPTNPLARDVDITLSREGAARLDCTLVVAPPAWNQLLPQGATWAWSLADTQPADWMEPGFDDAAWSRGPAPLGYGDEVLTDLLDGDPGADPPLTSWFRTTFEVADPERVEALEVHLRRDDGARVWLNGQEAVRDNLPDGTVDADTEALEKATGDDEKRFFQFADLDPALLVAGTNTVAVEVHQSDPYSSDAAMDLRIVARLGPPATPPAEHHALATAGGATQHRLRWKGLLPEATYACEVTSSCPGEAAAFEVTTSPLPDTVPRVALRGEGAPGWGAWTLFNVQRDCEQDWRNRLVILDPDGQVRWFYEIPDWNDSSSIDIEAAWIGDGTILWGGGDAPEGHPELLSIDQEVLYKATYEGSQRDLYHHDVEWHDGEILGMIDGEVVDGSASYDGFGLVQHDVETGEVTWRWDTQFAYDLGQLDPDDVVDPDNADDPWHPSSFASVTDALGEGVLVSFLHSYQVIRIDRDTGEISWTLGRNGDFELLAADGSPLDPELAFSATHALDVVGDHVLLYDNGWEPDRSSAQAWVVDPVAMTATQVFRYEEFDWYEPVWGDADELPSGTMLIDMAHNECKNGNPAHQGALVEVDMTSGEVVWRADLLDPMESSYRAQRIDGCEMFPIDRWCPARRAASATGTTR